MDHFEGVHVAGRRFEKYVKHLDLTPDRYQRILDVGSGFSTFVAESIEQDRFCVGVDIRYSDITRMAYEYINQPLPSSLDKIRRMFKFHVKDCDNYEDAAKAVKKMRQAKLQRFLSHYEKNKGHYVAGSCFNLPFFDGSFDLAVSVMLIGNKQYFNEEQTASSIVELRRVASEVRIYSHGLNGNFSSIESLIPHLEIEKVKEHLIVVH